MSKIILLTILFAFLCTNLFAQGRPYEGPDDPAGDIAAEREGWMAGNRVYLYFQNTTELSYCCGTRYSRWPNDHSGVPMTDGIGLLIAAHVYLENDSIPVDDPVVIQSRNDLQSLYFLQTSYRERMDKNSRGTLEWGLYPVFGYFNEYSEYPAMSNRPNSWPQFGWPARGDEIKWPGEWNGRFGRGIMYADLETYFVANDAQDLEYFADKLPTAYYPRPGVKIGDKKSDVTIQYGSPWGGVGIRVSQRGYQWNNPQTRDAIFWEYDITNISDYNITEMAFGYWVDNGIGGNNPTDDIAYFTDPFDLCYSWDIDGIGQEGLRPGVMGLAYLESPGIGSDGNDNDQDGLIDEKRDNKAEFMAGPLDGIADLAKFMDWYGYTDASQLREHWDADEDQDWADGEDSNNNGIYDQGEDAGDDVGLDGVGPGELNYTGPDADGSECNHKPDYVEGMGCEPNFAATDVAESDMVGLTSFTLFPIDHSSETWFEFDKPMFEIMAKKDLEEYEGNVSNLVEIFASGLFPLMQGRTERISLSVLHSYEALSGLNSSEHLAPALFQKKQIVQFIYESDYRFAQPPKMPALKAAAGDGKVYLSWNDAADKLTREPLLKGENDFEGYKLYKATDKYFSDAEKLMDMYGNPIGKKPIFQCDKVDNKYGAADFAHINGEIFYLGNESGIQHYFVDEDVQNGRTYYYGLAAYDYGMDGLEVAIMPSENNIVIDLDENEEIRFTGRNVQVVTPHQQAAGYVPPSISQMDQSDLKGSGIVEAVLFDELAIKADHRYAVTFDVDSVNFYKTTVQHHPMDIFYINNGYSVYDQTDGGRLVYRESPESFPKDNILERTVTGIGVNKSMHYIKNDEPIVSDIFDGIQLKINMPVVNAEYDSTISGWVRGRAPLKVKVSQLAENFFPWQYEIVFTGDSAWTTQTTKLIYIKDFDGDRIPESELILDYDFSFYVINKHSQDSLGNYEKLDLAVHDTNANGIFEPDSDYVLVSHIKDLSTERTQQTQTYQ